MSTAGGPAVRYFLSLVPKLRLVTPFRAKLRFARAGCLRVGAHCAPSRRHPRRGKCNFPPHGITKRSLVTRGKPAIRPVRHALFCLIYLTVAACDRSTPPQKPPRMKSFPKLLQELQQTLHPRLQQMEFGAIDISSLALPQGVSIHPDVTEYLSTSVPNGFLPIRVYELRGAYRDGKVSDEMLRVSYELYPVTDLVFVNSEISPQLWQNGFVAIGSDNGDELAFDVRSGALFRFEHDRAFELPEDFESIRKFALVRYASFAAFRTAALAAWRRDHDQP